MAVPAIPATFQFMKASIYPGMKKVKQCRPPIC
jgi:hypothetical protein